MTAHDDMKKFHYKDRRGFTLLLSTLIASLLLILGASMFGITKKEVILSSLGRDSQFAFYAADAGSECGLYWDFRHDLFATTTPNSTATCDQQLLGTFQFPGYGVPQNFEYQPNGHCVRVTVTKYDPALVGPTTIILSRGYNTTCAGIVTNPRALERSIELTF